MISNCNEAENITGIREVCNMLTYFQSLAYSHSPDIVANTETWLTSSLKQ